MTDEKPPASPTGITQVGGFAITPSMRDVMGPFMVDQAVRQAILQCWMSLPEGERSPERVEQEILRLMQRALRDMREDVAAFGFAKSDSV
jgi:hypothetical protein